MDKQLATFLHSAPAEGNLGLLPAVWSAAASHVEYLVTTRSRLPGWSAPEVAVRRRFRDFVALAELLKVRKVYGRDCAAFAGIVPAAVVVALHSCRAWSQQQYGNLQAVLYQPGSVAIQEPDCMCTVCAGQVPWLLCAAAA